MPQENPSAAAGAAAPSAWHKAIGPCARLLRRIPAKLLIAFFVLLGVVVFVLAVHTTTPSGTANLHVNLQHTLHSAQLKIWVDDHLTYQGRISGSMRKRFGLIPGTVQGSFSHTVRVPAGKHAVRMQVSALGEGYEEEASLQGEFPVNGEVSLVAAAKRHNLDLAWQGISAAAVDPGPAWYVKYGGSLLMTVAGSIVSAITAFLIRELPKLAQRGDTVSKA
jgi:hypothetical protein